MRQAGISGMVRRKRGRTTIRSPGVGVCEDLVDRAFVAAAPNRLRVANITYLRSWSVWTLAVAPPSTWEFQSTSQQMISIVVACSSAWAVGSLLN